MQAPVTTISLVQGQAMGGGFEAALAAHIHGCRKKCDDGFARSIV